MTIQRIAELCHEANRQYCKMLGDDSQPSWNEAPEWQKNSAINGVIMHVDNPDATPEDSHICWMKQKEKEGWKYGPVKDPEKKEHPCFLPYNELPIDQRVKDLIFKTVIHSFIAGSNDANWRP